MQGFSFLENISFGREINPKHALFERQCFGIYCTIGKFVNTLGWDLISLGSKSLKHYENQFNLYLKRAEIIVCFETASSDFWSQYRPPLYTILDILQYVLEINVIYCL